MHNLIGFLAAIIVVLLLIWGIVALFRAIFNSTCAQSNVIMVEKEKVSGGKNSRYNLRSGRNSKLYDSEKALSELNENVNKFYEKLNINK